MATFIEEKDHAGGRVRRIARKTMALIAMFFIASPAQAVLFTSTGTGGLWDASATWTAGVNFPDFFDDGLDSATVSSGDTLDVNAGGAEPYTIVTLTNNGILEGAADLTLTGASSNSSSATLRGTGLLIVEGGFNLGAGNQVVERSITNRTGSTLTWDGGSKSSTAVRTITNENGGIFDVNVVGTRTFGADVALDNAGSITATTQGPGNSATFLGSFTHTGSVNLAANNGTLGFTGGVTSTGGSFTVGAGSTLILGGAVSLDAASSVTGAGNVSFTTAGAKTVEGTYNVSGTTTISSGQTVEFNTTSTMGVIANAGILSGSGDITANGLVNGIVTGTGKLILNAGYSNTGTKTYQRDTDNQSGSTFTWNNGSLTGTAAAFDNKTGAVFSIAITSARSFGNLGGSFTNAGNVTANQTGGTATFLSDFTNTGTVQGNPTALTRFTGGYTQTAGTTIVDDGGLTMTGTSSFIGGAIEGGGTLTTIVDAVTGGGSGLTISPGLSIDTLMIAGNVTLDANDIIAIEVESSTLFDVLSVTGVLDLGGSALDWSLTSLVDFDSLTALSGPITIITASGGFSASVFGNVAFGDRVSFANSSSALLSLDGNNIQLSDFTPPVPEPSSCLLLGLGVLGLLQHTRRRRRKT